LVLSKRAGIIEAPEGWLMKLITSHSGTTLFKESGKIRQVLKFKMDELNKFVESLEGSTFVTLELTPAEKDIVELKVKGVGLYKGLPPYVLRPRGSLKSRILDPIAHEIEKLTAFKVVRKYRP